MEIRQRFIMQRAQANLTVPVEQQIEQFSVYIDLLMLLLLHFGKDQQLFHSKQ